LNQNVKHGPVLVDGLPQVVQFASDAHENLVQKPFVTGFWPPPLEGLSIGTPEAQAPLADGLVADHDAPRSQNQLDNQTAWLTISAGKRKPRYELGVVLMPEILP
jgi:hypothetical protein